MSTFKDRAGDAANIAEVMRTHIDQLADDLDIDVLVFWPAGMECERPCGAYAYVGRFGEDDEVPIIILSDPPIHAASYLVALHELGHHVTYADNELEREQAAWAWARETSLIEVEAEHEAFIATRLETYID